MRAAQLDQNETVINFAEVNSFTSEFVDPLDSVIGSTWDGTEFIPPIPPTPKPPDSSPIVTASFNSSLQRKAVVLQKEGKTFEAVQLLLKSQGVQS